MKNVIGDNAVIRSYTVIYTENRIGNHFETGHGTIIRENKIIGDDAIIGEDSLVGVGAVVTIDVPLQKIVGGNPVRIIKEISSLLYERKKDDDHSPR